MKVIRWKTEKSKWISQDIECVKETREVILYNSISFLTKKLGICFLKRNDSVCGSPWNFVIDAVGHNLFSRNTITQSWWRGLAWRTIGKCIVWNQAQFVVVLPILNKRRDILIHFIPAPIGTSKVVLHRVAVIQKLLLNKVAGQVLLLTHLVATLARLGNHYLTPRIR